MAQDPTNQKLSKQEVKGLLPSIREFNAISKAFIKLLRHKVEHKEKRLHTISVLIKNSPLPKLPIHSNLSIQTVDIGKTFFKKRGDVTTKKKMNWETEFRQNRNRGIIL